MEVAKVDPWQALGDPTRRTVLALVAERPRSVTEIAAELPVSRPAVSQHLRVLDDARLVTSHQDGRRRIYRPVPEGLERLRSELDRFWGQALTTFKELAEQATDEEGSP